MALLLELPDRDGFDLFTTLLTTLNMMEAEQAAAETPIYTKEITVIKATLFDIQNSQPKREWEDERRKHIVLYFTMKGESAYDIAQRIGIEPRSVQRLRQRLREEGVL